MSVDVEAVSARNLNELPIGVKARVRRVRRRGGMNRRLIEMGLVPGAEVEVRRVAPLGDPIEIRLRGSSLALRRAEASEVEIEPFDGGQGHGAGHGRGWRHRHGRKPAF